MPKNFLIKIYRTSLWKYIDKGFGLFLVFSVHIFLSFFSLDAQKLVEMVESNYYLKKKVILLVKKQKFEKF